MLHSRIDIPEGRVGRKDESLSTGRETGNNLLQMGLLFKVSTGIGRHQTMEFTGYMRRSDGTQNVMNGIPWAEGNAPINEELHHVSDQTALGHGKQIIQRLETFFAFGRRQRSLTAVLLCQYMSCENCLTGTCCRL